MKNGQNLMKKIEMSAFGTRPRGRDDIQVTSVITSVDIRAGYRPRPVFNKLSGINDEIIRKL